MQASAILVVSESPESALGGGFTYDWRCRPTRVPLACTHLLGQSVLERTVLRLENTGIRTIAVIAGAACDSSLPRNLKATIVGQLVDRWSVAAETLKEHAAQGVEDVFVIGLGPYTECDFGEALQFHHSKRNLRTQLSDGRGPLDIWIVNAATVRVLTREPDLFVSGDKTFGSSAPFVMNSYVNRLADAHDLRRLVVDAFLARCSIRPRGHQVKPGVWMDEGARQHRSARIVAPAYLGRSTTVARSSVIARFSNVESNCQVGAGTVVDRASILAHTALGRGLDFSDAVVDGDQVVDLRRNLSVRICDPNLVRVISHQPRGLSLHRRGPHAIRDRERFNPEYLSHPPQAAVEIPDISEGEA